MRGSSYFQRSISGRTKGASDFRWNAESRNSVSAKRDFGSDGHGSAGIGSAELPREAQPDNTEEGFKDYVSCNFGASQVAFVKCDGDFGDAEPPGLPGAIGGFHHEHVPHRKDAFIGQRLQRLAPPALEAAGQIRERHACNEARVPVPR